MTPTGLKLQLRREFDRELDVLQAIGTLLRISGRPDWHIPLREFKKQPHVLRRIVSVMLAEVDLEGLPSKELLVPVRLGFAIERDGVLIALADDAPEDQYSEMMVV